RRVLESRGHRPRDFVYRAPAKRVVRVTEEERLPRGIEERTSVGSALAHRRDGYPGLHIAQEEPLGDRVAALERRSRREGSLERPGVAVRIAQLHAAAGGVTHLGK